MTRLIKEPAVNGTVLLCRWTTSRSSETRLPRPEATVALLPAALALAIHRRHQPIGGQTLSPSRPQLTAERRVKGCASGGVKVPRTTATLAFPTTHLLKRNTGPQSWCCTWREHRLDPQQTAAEVVWA